jgi:hypothetical protein
LVVRCDDIGGIVDHPSLFKLPFQYQTIIQKIIQMKYNTKTTKLTKALKLENIERNGRANNIDAEFPGKSANCAALRSHIMETIVDEYCGQQIDIEELQ